jgi:hypothetical protein
MKRIRLNKTKYAPMYAPKKIKPQYHYDTGAFCGE